MNVERMRKAAGQADIYRMTCECGTVVSTVAQPAAWSGHGQPGRCPECGLRILLFVRTNDAWVEVVRA